MTQLSGVKTLILESSNDRHVYAQDTKLLVSTALVQKVLKKDILNYVTELIGISYLGSFRRFFFNLL